MIKFFRKIRQNLLVENRFNKYLLYAIGEIVLVVIGILIALQINNWNENVKNQTLEHNILDNILVDIDSDIEALSDMLHTDSLLVASNKKIINILKDKSSVYSMELDTMFGEINRYDLFYPRKIGYEALKSKGFAIISNNELKSSIVNLYDYHFSLIAELMDLKKQLYLNTNLVFNKHLETKTNAGDFQLRKPNDFEALKNSVEFINTLTNLTAEQALFVNYGGYIVEEMVFVREGLEKELNYKD